MSYKEPRTILIDQDKAMAAAIKYNVSIICRRICMWYIWQNACKNFSHVFNLIIDGRKQFKKDFTRCIYQFQHENDFKEAWNDMIAKYELQDNQWLKNLYLEKEKWALVYGRCRGMHSTLRSDNLNRRVEVYLNSSQKVLSDHHLYCKSWLWCMPMQHTWWFKMSTGVKWASEPSSTYVRA